MSSELTGVKLSSSEAKFVKDGITQGIRRDGRALLDSRHIFVKLSILPQANGSARVRRGFTSTDVLCGVRFEVGDVTESPLTCSVEMGALARSDLLGPIEASKRAEARAEELSDTLHSWLRNSLKLPDLLPGKAKWLVNVDCVVFGDGGNLLDALFLACYCAMHDARLPEFKVNEDMSDFEINPEFSAAHQIDLLDLSLPVTCWFVAEQCLLDPSGEEEACADAAVSVHLNVNGQITGTCKMGNSGVAPNTFISGVSVAATYGKRILKFIKSEVDSSTKRFESNIGTLIVQDSESWTEDCLSKSDF